MANVRRGKNDTLPHAVTPTGGCAPLNLTATGELKTTAVVFGGTFALVGDKADLDSGGGTDDHEVFAIGVPGPAGHLVAGTATTPLRIDPTGDTPQPALNSSFIFASTIFPLAGLATFTSVSVDAEDWGHVTGGVISDVAGTLTVEQSLDGGGSFDIVESFPISAGTALGFTCEVVGTHVRVVYANGAAPQLSFKLMAKVRAF